MTVAEVVEALNMVPDQSVDLVVEAAGEDWFPTRVFVEGDKVVLQCEEIEEADEGP